MSAERDAVARELAASLREWRLDDPWSDEARTSRTLFSDQELYDVQRVRLHESLVSERREQEPAPVAEGRLAVVVTAGPPGAGKTTALAEETRFAGYRDIDADDFKDALLTRAGEQGLLEEWTGRILHDGRPVAVRELSGFVHAESTAVAEAMRRACFADGENAIIHGTLSSVDYMRDLLGELDSYGYDRLTVLDVEVPVERAVDQALERWWTDRTESHDGLGGRFVAPAAVRSYYRAGKPTVTAENARSLHEYAVRLGWDAELRVVESAEAGRPTSLPR